MLTRLGVSQVSKVDCATIAVPWQNQFQLSIYFFLLLFFDSYYGLDFVVLNEICKVIIIDNLLDTEGNYNVNNKSTTRPVSEI